MTGNRERFCVLVYLIRYKMITRMRMLLNLLNFESSLRFLLCTQCKWV